MSIEELWWFHFTLAMATDFQHLAKILELTSGTLRVLALKLNPKHTRFLNELPLIRIGHLHQLSFMMMTRAHGLQCLQQCIQSLQSVAQSSQPPALQVMYIQLDTMYYWDPVLPAWPWSELDEIFSTPPFERRFRMLTIKVWKIWAPKITPEEAASRQALWGQFEAQFPRLAEKRRFSIQER
ncbi:hypothetical protein F5146DRAFT_1132393 [Armillaria mellea]|nr:hypothetical protein F5146DRAFT_1132393 [Armillaria mellea]